MARMIPSSIDEDTKSSAERKLFTMLRNMPDTDDWYVLHSVGIARHPTQSQGEADFVVIFPDGGTFALEVKGGRISYENGVWYSTDRFGIQNIIKNPVTEANNAMHALMSFIEKNNAENLQWSLFGFGVVFPDSTVHGRFSIPDLDDYQIADIDNYYDIKAYLLKLAGFWKSRKNARIFVPNKQQTNAIAAILRPNYDFKPAISSQIRSVEKQIITLTENQQMVFEGLFENERCLIKGSAGTGKTVLALESARTFAGQGKKVGLFCYNKNLAGWLQENIGNDTSIVCDSLLDYMEKELLASFSPAMEQMRKNDTAKYYSDVLPAQYAEHLIEQAHEPFDVLIIDEAQDVFETHYLEAIDLMLPGGLQNGNWYFFMDADKQNLYFAHTDYEKIAKSLDEYHSHFACYSLINNCRNSQAIIEKIDSIFGTHTKFRKMEMRGAEVEIRGYKRSQAQVEIVESILRQLKKEQICFDDIVILSASRFDRSVASDLDPAFPVSTERTDRKGKILFSTVHAFKGLESPIVVLVDFDSLDHDQRMNLLYVGMTRARSALYMVVSDKARQTLDVKIREAAKNG